MKVWKLRLCKIAPCVTLTALFGYSCAVVTEPTLLSQQLNTLVLAWLLVGNMVTIGVLAFALVYDHLEDLRALIVRGRPSPRLRFMTVPDPRWNAPTQGHIYGHRAVTTTERPSGDIFDRLERDMIDPPTGDVAA